MNSIGISEALALPVDWMLRSTVVYGASGTGKTSLGRVICEELHRLGQRFCAIDVKGDWWGLKSSVDGKSTGIPVVIFGGDHADVPLEADAGEFVAETVVGLGQSCIIDMEHLSKGKQLRFLAAFFSTLYHHNRDPLLLIMDEAQRYAPQVARGMDPQASICLGAVEDIVKMGRKHGLGRMLITQRGSGLNKEVSELCDMLIAFRSPGPLDQDRVRKWFEANTTKEQGDSVMGGIAKLSDGQAIFASGNPAIDVFGVYQVRRARTFDSSATPKVGEARIVPTAIAQPDLDALRTRMAESIERAKADNPKVLRDEITYLKKQLARWASEPVIKEVPVLSEKDLKRIEDLANHMAAWAPTLVEGCAKLAGSLGQLTISKVEAEAILEQPAPVSVRIGPMMPVSRQTGEMKPAIPSTPKRTMEGVSAPQQRILDAIAWWGAIGLSTPTRLQVGFISGYAHKSGNFSNILGSMKSAGLIEYPLGGCVSLTGEGAAAANNPTQAPTMMAFHNAVLDKLSGPQGKVLCVLLNAYPEPMTREDMGQCSGYAAKSGNFSNLVGSLKSLELIDYPEKGFCIASDLLFPKGLK